MYLEIDESRCNWVPNAGLTAHANSLVMSALRPLARAFQRPIARPSYAAFSTKSPKAIAPFTPSITARLQSRTKQGAKAAPAEAPMTKLVCATKRKASRLSLTGEQHVMQAAMPQLVPFYFVNETIFAWILLPSLIYILTKYLLPQQVRKMAGRLFVTKL